MSKQAKAEADGERRDDGAAAAFPAISESYDDMPAGDLLVQLSFRIQTVFTRLCAEHEAPPAQARLLGVLEGRSPTMAELAAHLDLEKSSLTGLVDRAEKRGLVRRIAHPADRRSQRVELTAQGARVEAAFRADGHKQLNALLDRLSAPEQAQLGLLLRRLLAGS